MSTPTTPTLLPKPTLARVLEMTEVLGPMLEDVTHHHDQDGVPVVSFTVLDLAHSSPIKVIHLNLTVEQAHWYLAGAINGTMWLQNLWARASAPTP